jgi:predicted TIM-barrel fold metal-dependent hydrolase
MKPVERIIDAHMHLWDLDLHRYPWLSDYDPATPSLHGDLTPIVRSYVLDDYLHDTRGYPIQKIVHVQAEIDRELAVAESRWLDGIADATGMPMAIVGFAGLQDPRVEQVLEEHARIGRVRGIRQMVSWDDDPLYRMSESPGLLANPDWIRGFGLLERYGLRFDLQAYPTQLADAVGLLDAHPGTTVIVEHAGLPRLADPAQMETWRDALRSLALHPTCSMKVSMLSAPNRGAAPGDLAAIIREVVEIFGTERVMYASNLPVDSLQIDFAEWMDIFGAAIGDLSPSEQDAIYFRNADGIYGL